MPSPPSASPPTSQGRRIDSPPPPPPPLVTATSTWRQNRRAALPRTAGGRGAAARDRGRDRAQGTRAGSRDLRPRSTALSLAFELSVVTQAVQTPASSSRAANPTDVMAAHRRRFGPTGRILAWREPTMTLAATTPARADHSSAGRSAHGPCARSSTSPAAAWTAPRTAAIRCRVRSRPTTPAPRSTRPRRRAAIDPRLGPGWRAASSSAAEVAAASCSAGSSTGRVELFSTRTAWPVCRSRASMERYPPVLPLCQVSVRPDRCEVIQASPIRPWLASATGSSAARPGA